MKTAELIAFVCIAVFPPFAADAPADTYTLDRSYGQVPVTFTPNEGQLDPPALFAVEGNNCNVLEENRGIIYNIFENAAKPLAKTAHVSQEYSYRFYLTFLGENESPSGAYDDPAPWNINYFIGSDPDGWLADVRTYKTVRLGNVYKGVDLVCTSDGRRIDFGLTVAPHTDLSQIQMQHGYHADYFKVNEDGGLSWIISDQYGSFTVTAPPPNGYQVVEGREIPVDIRFVLTDAAKKMLTFTADSYNPDYELVIELEKVKSPLWTLKYTTEVSGLDVDDEGNTYVAGKANNYLFVMKLNGRGDELGYVTYFGKTDLFPVICDIKVDREKSIFVAGNGAREDFPITQNEFYNPENTSVSCFVLKLNELGNNIIFSSHIAGTVQDEIYGLSIDSYGNTYITGRTRSNDFPSTYGSFDESFNGGSFDAFVSKISEDGKKLIFSTFIGGNNHDYSNGIDIDESGNIYLTGITYSNNFPVTPGAYDECFNGVYQDGFITKLSNDGSRIIFSTYLGGKDYDECNAIKVDTSGNIYVTGRTASIDYPTTTEAFNTTYNGGYRDAFITEINESNNKIIYSTLFGGNLNKTDTAMTSGSSLTVDNDGNIYVIGVTNIPDFPVKQYISYKGNGFLSIVDGIRKELTFSSYLELRIKKIIRDNNKNIFLLCFITDPSDLPPLLKITTTNKSNVNDNKNNEIVLKKPYPNPFNGLVTISYYVGIKVNIEISIYDITGQRLDVLEKDIKKPGTYLITWNAKKYASGLYLCGIKSDNYLKTEKLFLLK